MHTAIGLRRKAGVIFAFLTLTLFGGLDAHALSSQQEFARVAVEAIWSQWSKPNRDAISYLDSRYSERLRYYNKDAHKAEVMQLKREYAGRWPERDYHTAPGSLEITCDDASHVCSVKGRVYWDARSPARDRRAVGLANFEYGILQTENAFKIVSESGDVIHNTPSSLTADASGLLTPLGTSLSPFQNQPRLAALRTSQISKAVMYCFNQGEGKLTVQQMFDCSGMWVTPKALLRCSLETQCPALPDTLNGRATLNSLLQADNLTLSSVLTIRPADLPAMPSFQQIGECKTVAKSEMDFVKCASIKPEAKQLTDLRECIKSNSGVSQAKCITASIKDEKLEKMVSCLGGKTPEANAVNNCLNSAEVAQKLDAMRKCAKSASSLAASAGCISSDLPAGQKKVAECLAQSENRPDSMNCLNEISPEVAKANAVMQCMNLPAGTGKKKVADCLAKEVPGLSGKVAGCLSSANQIEAARCMIGDKPELQAAEQLYNCASKGRDMALVIEHCTSALNLDPKTQMTLACAAKAGFAARGCAVCGLCNH
jgi:hypothetical protein